MDLEEDNQKTHCNTCGHLTKHELLKADREEGSTEEFECADVSQMLKCCGCGEVVLRRIHYFSEDPEPNIEYFPPPISRRLPTWYYKLPNRSMSLLKEVYKALQADSPRLAMMGARALLDRVIVDKVGDKGSFRNGLDALEKAGFVSSRNRSFLVAAFDAGSAAAHRGHLASREEISAAMDIVENLLQAVYALESLAKQLRQATPSRSRVRRKTQP
jgi:hypothetical protein